MPIETRRGGRAMFYQARAMNALAVIAILAENQDTIFGTMIIREKIIII